MREGFIVGFFLGLIPVFFLGKSESKEKVAFALGGFLACIVSGTVLGLIGALPVCALFVALIVNKDRDKVTRRDNLDSSLDIELTFWNSIQSSDDAEDFKAYLDKYPQGQFATIAQNRIRRLSADF